MSQPVLKQYETVKFSRIYALGAARGDLAVTNDDVAGPIDSSDEWIRQRTGIITRKRASKDLSLMDMAVDASN
jgi:3-oxoacyl-[acyl-carrier-protein] synthase-3